jgi:transcriptional regulator with GAF, ATPase, and Fis domain
MHNLFEAGEIITSNLLYRQIIQNFDNIFHPQDALLLVPVTNGSEDLEVVEVIGALPTALGYTDAAALFAELPAFARDVVISDEFSRYNNLIKFMGMDDHTYAYLLFAAEEAALPELEYFVSSCTHLLGIKNAIDSLPDMVKTQSKLKYQISFFASTINNVFEPYGIEILIQLYMEILSEMFLLPAAVTLKADDSYYRPVYAKGGNIKDFEDFRLQAAPFQRNWNLKTYPSFMSDLTIEQLGQDNYDALAQKSSYLLAPVSYGDQDYLIICVSCEGSSFDDADKTSLIALSNTINHAVQFSYARENLMLANKTLDQKVYSLTTLYHAAQIIFSNNDLTNTLSSALDMVMEIFQSSISAVVLKNSLDDNYKLFNVKSIHPTDRLEYLFNSPSTSLSMPRLLIDYQNSEQKEEFLSLFPDFSNLEEQLQPVLVAQLTRENHYYGFISLSTRVTGQSYDQADRELLTLLINSITIAIENALILKELETTNSMLDDSLQNLYAIQEVLTTIRQAERIEDFCQLLASALKLGLGVESMAIIGKGSNEWELLQGDKKLAEKMGSKLNSIGSTVICNLFEPEQSLVVPISHHDQIQGFLLIDAFKGTTIEDSEKSRLLSMISIIIGETFNNLLEKKAVSKFGFDNYPRLIMHRLGKHINSLKDLGLDANILKFTHPNPETVLMACVEWSEGFVLRPDTGVIVSPLAKVDIIDKLSSLTTQYCFIPAASDEELCTNLFV